MKIIAIISARVSDFESHVNDIYQKLPTPKTKLRVGNKISVVSGKSETKYVLIQTVSDMQGIRADGYEKMFSAYDLPEYIEIMKEIAIRQSR